MGPIEAACTEIAERFCCGVEGGEARVACEGSVKYDACQLIGSAPSAGCMNGGPCIRSTVDFAECNAVLDSAGDLCEVTCWATGGSPPCFELPEVCISDPCPTLASGCAED